MICNAFQIQKQRRDMLGDYIKLIPLSWLGLALKIPGKAAIQVALYLAYCDGRQCSNIVTIDYKTLETKFGVKDDSARRALKALEGANLISVNRHIGRIPPIAKILNYPRVTSKKNT